MRSSEGIGYSKTFAAYCCSSTQKVLWGFKGLEISVGCGVKLASIKLQKFWWAGLAEAYSPICQKSCFYPFLWFESSGSFQKKPLKLIGLHSLVRQARCLARGQLLSHSSECVLCFSNGCLWRRKHCLYVGIMKVEWVFPHLLGRDLVGNRPTLP